MGGKDDATNVRRKGPEVAIVTSIGLDHMEFLGDTHAKIAATKSGIFRRGAPVVYGAGVPKEAEEAILAAAAHTGCNDVIAATQAERIGGGGLGGAPVKARWGGVDFDIGIRGGYQVENAGVAFAALRVMQASGGWNITDSHICQGMSDARIAGWGRAPSHRGTARDSCGMFFRLF